MTFSEKNCNTCGQKCAIKYHGCSNWIPINDGELLIPISVLDKIRAEIERRGGNDEKAFCKSLNESYKLGLREAIDIIDKYKAESEEIC